MWLRYQPDSALSKWFRVGDGRRRRRRRRRIRKVMIVALACKLLVALWHFCRHGVLPEGAALKAA